MAYASNVTVACFSGGARRTVTTEIYQYSYGQILVIEGLELPESYRVDFANDKERSYSKPQIGTAEGVAIPDEYLLSGKPVFAFVLLSVGENDLATE